MIMDLVFIFITGLTTGGLTCLAMQGGLLASVIANQKEQEHDEVLQSPGTKVTASFDQLDWLPVVMFLGTKLVAHTILGFLLGLIGSAITLSLGARLGFQLFTALFMFATAMNLLNVHPVFRYMAFQPPRFLQRFIRQSAKSKALFAPAVMGVLTIFIPCGVTQAMALLAVNSGNPVYGALIMFSFVLGTSPLFALVGVATARLSETWYRGFMRFAAVALIIMSLYALNGVLVVVDSPMSVQNTLERVRTTMAQRQEGPGVVPVSESGVQEVTIGVFNSGYSPNYFKVQKDVPVQLTLQSNETYSCAVAFVFREFGINTFLKPIGSETFTFTPTTPGRYMFACSMGMYTGVMEVI